MRRALRLIAVASLLAPVAACGSGGDRSSPDPKAALLHPSELPGGHWSLLGTTDRRPQVGDAADPLDDAEGTTSQCRSALDGLDAATAGPSPDDTSEPFARAVYRPSGSTPGGQDHDVTLTIESAASAGRSVAAIDAVTKACTKTMTTQAGAQELEVKISRTKYATPGATGYSITYDADGLRHSFDMAALVAGSQGVTASTTGSSAANNRRTLDAVLSRTATKLGAPAAPTGGSTTAPSATSSSSSSGAVSPTNSATGSATGRTSSQSPSSSRSTSATSTEDGERSTSRSSRSSTSTTTSGD